MPTQRSAVRVAVAALWLSLDLNPIAAPYFQSFILREPTEGTSPQRTTVTRLSSGALFAMHGAFFASQSSIVIPVDAGISASILSFRHTPGLDVRTPTVDHAMSDPPSRQLQY